jgi:hypothetical protein
MQSSLLGQCCQGRKRCSAINWKAGSGRTQKWVVGFMATTLKGSFVVLRRSGICAHGRKVDAPHSQWKTCYRKVECGYLERVITDQWCWSVVLVSGAVDRFRHFPVGILWRLGICMSAFGCRNMRFLVATSSIFEMLALRIGEATWDMCRHGCESVLMLIAWSKSEAV